MRLFIKDVSMVIVGALSYALALTIFAIPNQLTEGGVPGAAVILHYAFDWSPGIITFILTSTIMVIGFRSLPKRTIILSLITIPMISLFMYLTENMGKSFGDPFVSAIFAGFFIGVGSGFIFRTGSSMGGTSLIALMLKRKLGWDMVRTIFILDVIIVLSGTFIIGPLHVMYTIITLFIAKKSTDLIMDGIQKKKAVSVISPHSTLIANEIIENMNTSVTVFNGYGGYLKKDTNMIYIIINKFQIIHLKKIVSEIDKSSFVVIHDVRDVVGGSFAWKEEIMDDV